jgi:hypothetical protein
MGLEKSLKILEDVMDVMAQVKQPAEDTIHRDISVKRFKEMARAPKEKKKNRWQRFWLLSLSNFLRFWSLFNGEGCGVTKNRHHHWAVGGNGAVSSKVVEKGVVNT